MNNKEYIHFDEIFSYWIFIWVFIYYFASKNRNNKLGNFIYEKTNPIFLVYLAILDNIFVFFTILYYNPKIIIIIKYIFIFIIIKLIPLQLLQNTKINMFYNIIFSIILFIIYNIYLFNFYNTNIFIIYDKISESIINNDNKTPFYYFLNSFVSLFDFRF